MKTVRRCLILSQGPVPVPEHKQVEGGGLRCWGLAKGIYANDDAIDITVAYNESYRQKEFTSSFEGISLTTWDNDTLAAILEEYDTVIVSYCMADLSVKVVDALRPDQQLILDCYVPIYVEISARNSDDVDREYAAFHQDIGRWAHVLRRGDFFLCASESQRQYYKGVLSALGRINPVTYGEELLLIAPYGVYREKPQPSAKPISAIIDKSGGKKFRKILWFGGIYPWFDLSALVDAVAFVNQKIPAKLIIVGARNPFNKHPDFVQAYEKLLSYVNEDEARKENIIFQDWVGFDERANWYLDSDLVVVINRMGEENALAWRTRLVDYIWADLPILTNGGDPLGEILLNNNAALRVGGLSAEAIGGSLINSLTDLAELSKVKANLQKVRSLFYWDKVTEELTAHISDHRRAADFERQGLYEVVQPAPVVHRQLARAKNIAKKASAVPAYTKKYGVKNTYHVLRNKVSTRVVSKLGRGRTQPGVIMISHQLDFSGAPYVFMDLAENIKNDLPDTPLEFHTFNPALKENISRLNKLGIKPKIHLSKDITIPFIAKDVVVLNTVDQSQTLMDSLYEGLEKDILEKLIWFIHEDEPELIFNHYTKARIKKLLDNSKMVLFVAADKTLQNYRAYFGNTRNIRKQPYKYCIPQKFQKIRSPEDFDTLSFILPGTVSDGRKGQLPVFYAFANFIDRYYKGNEQDYRDFELVYVGITEDFLSRQVLKHAKHTLGKRFMHYGRVTHERSSELIMKSNVTICYSLRECLPLFVFEGMAAGHPILRNDCSGIDEQLFENQNGYLLESNDFFQVVTVIERVLNKKKTSNDTLASMSAFSNKVAVAQADNTYAPIIREISRR